MFDCREFPTRDELRVWAITNAPEGAAVEFGVGCGESLAQFAQHRFVYGFDSFEGLPEQWRDYPEGSFAHPPPHIPNTELIVGVFAETVPEFVAKNIAVGFVHVDCDLYGSTRDALRIAPVLVDGAIILFDEYCDYPGWENHEHKALLESGLEFDYAGYVDERVAIRYHTNLGKG